MGTQRSVADFKVALVFSMLGVIPHLIYTVLVFFTFSHIGLYKALILGVMGWSVAAAILVLAWQQYQL